MKLRLLRKVEHLESLISPVPVSGPRDAVVGVALARVATDDLLLLIEACQAELPYAQWNPDQVCAGESLRKALEGACVDAGFPSVAAFERLCPAVPAPLTHRRMVRR